MKQIVKNIIRDTPRLFNLAMYVFFTRQFKKYLKIQNIPNKPCDGEKEYIERWSKFNTTVEPYSYRLFSRYVQMERENIVPENIGRCYIEPVLNPVKMRPVYEDKNMFPVLCGKDVFPLTLVCRMGGGPILDSDLKTLTKSFDIYFEGYDRVILKPSVDSGSGKDIHLFVREDGKFISKYDGSVMTIEFLLQYSKDFVVQEAINQHPSLAVFNSSSVNTLRIAVYRSVIDNEPHVLASVMRVGKSGMFVDNAHAGGLFVGIDIKTGEVDKALFDQYGNKYSSLNSLDYSTGSYKIPHWEKAKEFTCNVARKLVHHRLFAFDVTIDSEGNPKLLEYNISAFSYWLFMFTNQKALGEYTDEIIEYCSVYKQ